MFTRKPEEILHQNGFTEIEPFTSEPGYNAFMVRVGDSQVWHYAHMDGNHGLMINLAAAYIAESGKLAVYKYIINRETERIQHLEAQLSILKQGLVITNELYEKRG
jgi:hypothetical protein